MNETINLDLDPPYFAKVKALGFSIVKHESELAIVPLKAHESWILRFQDDRWILYVRDIPQIAFQPEEVVKFLVRRKFPPKETSTLAFSSFL